MLQLAAAVVFVALLMASPSEALAAARQAIAVWAGSFLPALLPFFAVTPALSSDEAARLYAKLFGRAFECLFGCPGQLSGAAMIGLMAGSPAGAIAAGRLRGHATGAELTRGALLASGVSPGFMISAVGAAMLGDARLGAILLRAQLGALVIGGLLLRRAFSGGRTLAPPDVGEAKKGDALMGAALSMLSVCAHMVVFAVAVLVIAEILPAGCETGVLAAMAFAVAVPWGAEMLTTRFRTFAPYAAHLPPLWAFALLGLVGSVAAQIGDLTASMVKRYCGIKDYGAIFPGHGGMLDRMDSVLFSGVILYVFFTFSAGW